VYEGEDDDGKDDSEDGVEVVFVHSKGQGDAGGGRVLGVYDDHNEDGCADCGSVEERFRDSRVQKGRMRQEG